MKRYLLSIGVIFFTAATSQALSTQSTWAEIFKRKGVTLIYEESLGGISLSNACASEKYIQAIKPIRYCDKLVVVNPNENGDRYAKWICDSWITGPYAYPRAQKGLAFIKNTIAVRVVVQTGSYSNYPGFQKYYTFPECKD